MDTCVHQLLELTSEVTGVVVSQGESGEPFQNFVGCPLQKRSRDLRRLRQRHSSKMITDSRIKWLVFSRVETNGFVVLCFQPTEVRLGRWRHGPDCGLCARYLVTKCSAVWIVRGELVICAARIHVMSCVCPNKSHLKISICIPVMWLQNKQISRLLLFCFAYYSPAGCTMLQAK